LSTGLVTLLTDFGLDDPFVGIMKGVMLREAPGLTLVDLTHGIPAQDVEAAAFTLAHSFGWFAPGAVHLCVVDPGVGSERAAVALQARGHTFVGPDNGLFSAVQDLEPNAAARRIDPAELGLTLASRTFHGRDLFAPVAAWLASGRRRFEELGSVHELSRRPRPRPEQSPAGASGRVVLVDHFGNLITDLPGSWLEAGAFRVEIGKYVVRLVGTYSEAKLGECVALVSSFGTLEIAQRDGNAAETLGFGRGEVVRAAPLRAP
jgi:S-adenosylmethionine hydrolase